MHVRSYAKQHAIEHNPQWRDCSVGFSVIVVSIQSLLWFICLPQFLTVHAHERYVLYKWPFYTTPIFPAFCFLLEQTYFSQIFMLAEWAQTLWPSTVVQEVHVLSKAMCTPYCTLSVYCSVGACVWQDVLNVHLRWVHKYYWHMVWLSCS